MKKGKILNGYGVLSLILIVYLFFAYQKEQRAEFMLKVDKGVVVTKLRERRHELFNDIVESEKELRQAGTKEEKEHYQNKLNEKKEELRQVEDELLNGSKDTTESES